MPESPRGRSRFPSIRHPRGVLPHAGRIRRAVHTTAAARPGARRRPTTVAEVTTTPTTSYVALLRGINVGGRNKVPMQTLRELIAGIGGADVRTHLQSGNAVFTHGEEDPQRAGRTSWSRPSPRSWG